MFIQKQGIERFTILTKAYYFKWPDENVISNSFGACNKYLKKTVKVKQTENMDQSSCICYIDTLRCR